MEPREYQRDGRAPLPVGKHTSHTMSRIRARHTKPELAMRHALRTLGAKGYRLHYKKASGRPDIAFVGRRVAVFVHGCFWHSCPHCSPARPKTHVTFWNTKLDANKARDARKAKQLRGEGWRVITCWECQIRTNALRQAERVVRILEQAA